MDSKNHADLIQIPEEKIYYMKHPSKWITVFGLIFYVNSKIMSSGVRQVTMLTFVPDF